MSQEEKKENEVKKSDAKPKKKGLGMTSWILIALVAGIVAGLACNTLVASGSWFDTYMLDGVFYVLGKGFIRLMQMIVAPLVFCSIVCGAASMSDPKMLGKVGGGTIIMFLGTTAIAILIAIGLSQITNPGLGLDMASVIKEEPKVAESQSFADVLLNIIPTNIFAALSDGTMLQIIFFALLLGFLLGNLGKKVATVNRFFTQFNAIMMTMISWILKVAPIGIFCLITNTFAGLGISGILPMIKLIGTVYLGLIIQLLVVYSIILFIFTRMNPLKFLKKVWPVLVFGFSTSSSNATIPLNMETLEKRVGVDPKVASFTIPLGATINMDGTAIMQGAAVVFAAQAFGIDLPTSALLSVVVTATAASIGTAGVPGVGTIMLAMVFSSVGLPAEGVAMIMGVDRILDMGRTAINVTGDAVVTTCIAGAVGMIDRETFNSNEVVEVGGSVSLPDLNEPEDYDDFIEPGEATEIGEDGSPDKFEDMDYPVTREK